MELWSNAVTEVLGNILLCLQLVKKLNDFNSNYEYLKNKWSLLEWNQWLFIYDFTFIYDFLASTTLVWFTDKRSILWALLNVLWQKA